MTGPAGSGKTYLLNQFVRHLRSKKIGVAVTASTGIAATHLRGRTIHSWSGIGIKKKFTKADWGRIKRAHLLKKRIFKADVLIIDEVSMLHNYQLDLVDQICRFIREEEAPFGGIQVVMCGDFFQLPPVSDDNEKSKNVLYSEVWPKMNLQVCYLDKVIRQDDERLTRILNRIREKRTDGLVDFFNRFTEEEKKLPANLVRLYTHNIDVDAINFCELKKIREEARTFLMEKKGADQLVGILKGMCQAPEKLVLKKGAIVMFVKNNQDLGYANGTIGQVVNFHENSGRPIVVTTERKRIVVDKESWPLEDEDGKTLASIDQIPLKLAWAITVHKSQGTTLSAVEMDLSRCFAYGMGYVALSRARSLESIRLLGINSKALEVDPKIFEIDKILLELSAAIEKKNR